MGLFPSTKEEARSPSRISQYRIAGLPDGTGQYWGYKRIQGELKKLEIILSKSTVANILRRNNLPPSPERKGLTWREFLARHAKAFLCTDLFTKEVWTFGGLKTAYVLFIVHLESRQVLWMRATYSPNSRWLMQQIRHVLWECDEKQIEVKFFLHDNDSCFSDRFDAMLSGCGIMPLRTPYQAPNANAHAERFVKSIKREYLDHLMVIGLTRLQACGLHPEF